MSEKQKRKYVKNQIDARTSFFVRFIYDGLEAIAIIIFVFNAHMYYACIWTLSLIVGWWVRSASTNIINIYKDTMNGTGTCKESTDA